MTREEAIQELKSDIEWSKLNQYPYIGQRKVKAINMAIEALEQESNLDKIRAEIEQAADKHFQIAMHITDSRNRHTHIRIEDAYRHSLNIIDKYKIESEEEND